MKYKVGVVGIGRVGLPLALSLSKNGLSTLGFDIDQETINSVNSKKMPFHETGYQKLIEKLNLEATADFSRLKEVENIVITVGTPLLAHIETDLSQLNKVLISIIKYLEAGQNIILRSTVAPKTTSYVHRFIESNTNFKIGQDIYLSFCPERIAEGKAMAELESLPQIIGSKDNESAQRAEAVFSSLGTKIFHTDYISAELVKLFNNTYRYINFSISNQFAMIANSYGASIYDILDMTNTEYPRSNIPSPGLTAGTCLRKDFGMISETTSYSDLLLNAWKVNEFIPKFLVEEVMNIKPIHDQNIGILGYTFKQNADDTRDSLVPKMIRYIEREVPKNMYIHEPYIDGMLDDKYQNSDLQLVLNNADIIFIALNHSDFTNNIQQIIDASKDNCVFVDFWNVSGKNQMIFTKG